MKKIISVLLALTLCVSALCLCTACKGTAETDTTASPTDTTELSPVIGITGGWTVSEEASEAELPEGAKEAFNLAMAELDGVEYTPIAFLGTQVVAGTNYAYLCRGTVMSAEPVTNLYIVKVYEDLSGNAEVLDISDVNIADYTADTDLDFAPETLAGGWTIPTDTAAATLPEDVQTAFDLALAELVGVNYTPVAYLGSQVVAGSNYAVLCRADAVTESSASAFAVLTVYADLSGGAELTSVSGFEIP